MAAPDPDFVDLKRKYLEALLKKVEEGDADPELLGRVQVLLFEQARDKKPSADGLAADGLAAFGKLFRQTL